MNSADYNHREFGRYERTVKAHIGKQFIRISIKHPVFDKKNKYYE